MQRVTGWTTAQLRAEPARVIRAHFARIFAALIWSPELATAAATPVADRKAYGSLDDWSRARAGKRQAIEAMATVTAALWPEDDDG